MKKIFFICIFRKCNAPCTTITCSAVNNVIL